MGETAAWQSDERIAPGLHMNRQDSEQGSALVNVGGEKSSNRRITADSFRLLTARLKQRPIAFPAPVILPEPIIPAAVEILQEPVISAPVAPVEPSEEFSFPEAGIEPPQVIEKRPWAWLEPEVPTEVEPAAPAFKDEVPVQDSIREEPAPAPGPEEEIPFAKLFSSPPPAKPELEAEEPMAAPAVAEVAPEPEKEIPFAELFTAPPPVEPEPEVGESIGPPVEAKAAPGPQAVNGKLGTDYLPTSGIVVPGIGDISKAIYMTPTPADRAAFLAEMAVIMAAAEAEAENVKSEVPSIVNSDPIAPAKPQVRRVKAEDDPFAKLALAEAADNAADEQPDEDAGELARSLLDMMLSNPSAGQPQERALAADALLKLVPRIPLRALVLVVDRLSIMESPPHLLVSKLIHDPRIEVAGPLLELCNHISDQVLGKVVATGQVSLQRLIARRRHISAHLSDQLIEFDDPSVILTLVRNSGAVFSHHAFPVLADHASRNHAVLAPLATRPDLPAPIAFELFWFVPAELRRYLLSRFLTDSETLTKILKITHAMGGGEQGAETKFPEREQIETFVEFLSAGNLSEATNILAEIAAIQPDNAARIISDANGEPLTIAFKAIGTNRARFGEIIEIIKTSDFGIIANQRGSAELQNIFDSMSFNKARVLLTYWDWAVLKSGPYAPAN